jgi:CDGSH-type Zn-finger protein
MIGEVEKKSNISNDSMKITVLMNGPYIVTGRVPLITMEICKDEDTDRLIWREVKKHPIKKQYALCRCGQSGNKPSCDGTHTKVHFDGTEAGDFEPFRRDEGESPSIYWRDESRISPNFRYLITYLYFPTYTLLLSFVLEAANATEAA